MLRSFALVAILLVAVPGSASAQQTLIPSPYPSGVSGAAPLDPEPQGMGGPQTLKDDPYPQILGENAQGNPPVTRHHRHQHLVSSIFKRKYRVERH